MSQESVDQELGKGYQADIFIRDYKGQKALLKSITHPELPILRSFEQWILMREAEALKCLNNVEGVPSFLGFPDQYTIAMEFCEGKTLREAEGSRLGPAFFEKLEDLIQTIHEQGIIHSDLKKKDNILVTPENKPVVVDFGTILKRESKYKYVGGFLYSQFQQMDLNAVSKLKQEFCPDSTERIDEDRLRNPVILERLDRIRRNYVIDW